MQKNPMAGIKPMTLKALSTLTIFLQVLALNTSKDNSTASFFRIRTEFHSDSLTALAMIVLCITSWVGRID